MTYIWRHRGKLARQLGTVSDAVNDNNSDTVVTCNQDKFVIGDNFHGLHFATTNSTQSVNVLNGNQV
jgi:hypothetical protein